MVRLMPRVFNCWEMDWVPGEWLTPPLKAGMVVSARDVRAYIDDLIISRAWIVSLDTGEVLVELPDKPICLIPPDQYNPRGTWLPQTKWATLVGQVELRLEDKARVRDELQSLPRELVRWTGPV